METIRSVDDKPVNNVKEFEAAIKGGGEFKLSVKRMTKGRTVKLKIDPAGTGKPELAQEKPKELGAGATASPSAGRACASAGTHTFPLG